MRVKGMVKAGQASKAGMLRAAERLHPTSRGVQLRDVGASHAVIDGPVAATRELVAGFWPWPVRSMDEATEWARRCPHPQAEPCEVNVRPAFETEAFDAAMAPQRRAREDRMRQCVAASAKP